MRFQHFKILVLLFSSVFMTQCRKKSQSESATVYKMNADALSQGRILYVDHPGALLTSEDGLTQFSQGTTDDSWLKDDLVWIVLAKENYPDLAAESNLDGDISIAVRSSDLKFVENSLALATPRSDGIVRSGSERINRQGSTPDLRRTQSDPAIRDSLSSDVSRNDSLSSPNRDLLSETNSIRSITSDVSSRVPVQASVQISFLDKASGFFKSIRSSIRNLFSNIGTAFQNFLTRFSSRNSASANINDISDSNTSVARLQTTSQGTLVLSRPLKDSTRTSNHAVVIRGQGNSDNSTPLQSFFLNPLQKQAIAAARVAYNSDLTVKRQDVEAFWNIVALPEGSSVRLDDALPGIFNQNNEVRARVALPIIIEAATRMQQGLSPVANTATTSRQIIQQQPTRDLTYAPLASRLQDVVNTTPNQAISVDGLNTRPGDAENTSRLVEVIRPQSEDSTPATDLARTFENTSPRESENDAISPRESQVIEQRIFEDIKQGRKWPIKALASVAVLSGAMLAIIYASIPSDEDDQNTEISFIEDPIQKTPTDEETPSTEESDNTSEDTNNNDEEPTNEVGDAVIVEDNTEEEDTNTPEEDDTEETTGIDSEESINDISLPSRDTEENVAASEANDEVIQVGEGVNSTTVDDSVGRTVLIDANGILGFIAIRPAGAEQGAVDLSRAVQFKGRIQARDTGYSLGCSTGCLRLVPQQ